MAIKDIVVQQGPDSRSVARLEIAINLAKTHGARIIGVFAMADLQDARFWLIPPGKKWIEASREILKKSAADCEDVFNARIAAEGLGGEWRTVSGLPTSILAISGRAGDLTIVSQTDPQESIYGGGIPDHLVLSVGGPVLLVPYIGEFKDLDRRVMIAWNGTREAARAVRDAIPLLSRAEMVLVYVVSPTGQDPLAGADICAHLERHGIKTELQHAGLGAESDAVDSSLTTVGDFGFQQPGVCAQSRHPEVGEFSIGDTLLNAVTDNAVDLLVMGAYGHSRVRELVLGGATRRILDAMTVPVLMSN
jgi:nucleotide-binding universal stress UspA family protein